MTVRINQDCVDKSIMFGYIQVVWINPDCLDKLGQREQVLYTEVKIAEESDCTLTKKFGTQLSTIWEMWPNFVKVRYIMQVRSSQNCWACDVQPGHVLYRVSVPPPPPAWLDAPSCGHGAGSACCQTLQQRTVKGWVVVIICKYMA